MFITWTPRQTPITHYGLFKDKIAFDPKGIILIKWYQKLGQIRKTYSAFKNGEYQEIFVSDGIYIFKRFDKKSEVMIAVNLSEKDVDLQFNGKLYELVLEEEFVNSFTLNQSSVAIMISID